MSVSPCCARPLAVTRAVAAHTPLRMHPLLHSTLRLSCRLQPARVHCRSFSKRLARTASPNCVTATLAMEGETAGATVSAGNTLKDNYRLDAPCFLPVHGNGPSPPDAEELPVKVVSYNLLAQVYVRSSWYPYAPSAALKWHRRSSALVEELVSFDADFLCLQEVDTFETFYKPMLAEAGYDAIYKKRTGVKKDGSAVFFRKDKFELIQSEGIEFNDIAAKHLQLTEAGHPTSVRATGSLPTNGSVQHDYNDPHVRLSRDCVAVMGMFRSKELPHKALVMASTHLYWDPQLDDVKLAQASHLLEALASFRSQAASSSDSRGSGHDGKTLPIVVCGDFNSTPDSNVYKLITSGPVTIPAPCWHKLNNHQSSNERPSGMIDVPAPLRLSSAYSVYNTCVNGQDEAGEPNFTTYSPDFKATIDYIMHSGLPALRLTHLLRLPEAGNGTVGVGIPNEGHPSDHLPIAAVFGWL